MGAVRSRAAWPGRRWGSLVKRTHRCPSLCRRPDTSRRRHRQSAGNQPNTRNRTEPNGRTHVTHAAPTDDVGGRTNSLTYSVAVPLFLRIATAVVALALAASAGYLAWR